MTIVPSVLNLVAGETHKIQALNASGLPVTGLTWTSSDTKVVTLSTDDPPVLTALTAGRATITAGGASADITVFADTLPVGTVIWSNPGDGSGVAKIVPALPSASGVADVFAFQGDGTVQAIQSDGTTAWTANANIATVQAIPDFQGGLVLVNYAQSIVKLDGITGAAYPAYMVEATDYLAGQPAIHTDGTVFAIIGVWSTGAPWLVGIEPTTGRKKFSIQIGPTPVYTSSGGDNWTETNNPYVLAAPMIAGDGYAYVVYDYTTGTRIDSDNSQFTDSTLHLMLLRVGSDGSSTNIALKDWEQTSVYSRDYGTVTTGSFPGGVSATPPITNGDTGVLVAWDANMYQGQHTYGVATTSGESASSTTTSIPSQAGPLTPILQAQDGTFVGTVSIGPSPGTVTQTNMIAFDQSGKVKWSVPNDSPQIATADGGVIGASGITYDASGNTTGQGALPGTPSWQGFLYSGTGDPVVQNKISSAQRLTADSNQVAGDQGVQRKVPPASFSKIDPLRSAGSNVSGNRTTLNLPDDPWSLRLVPVKDNGGRDDNGVRVPMRYITYALRKLDGIHKPNGTWYVTEHQTNHSLTDTNDGMSSGPANTFPDNIGCYSALVCGSTTHQTFTISPNPGNCGQPSYGNVGNTTCKNTGSGTIVVHTESGDFGVLWMSIHWEDITVNDLYRWPGVN
jgi:hypothetical protein